jgi:integrase
MSPNLLRMAGCDVPHWTQHDLRRTLRTELSRAGVRNEVAEMVIAHKRQGVEAVYDLHRFDAEKRAALPAWEERLRAIVGAPTGASETPRPADVAE